MSKPKQVIFDALCAQSSRQAGEEFRKYHDRQTEAVYKALADNGYSLVSDAMLDSLLDELERLQTEVEDDG